MQELKLNHKVRYHHVRAIDTELRRYGLHGHELKKFLQHPEVDL